MRKHIVESNLSLDERERVVISTCNGKKNPAKQHLLGTAFGACRKRPAAKRCEALILVEHTALHDERFDGFFFEFFPSLLYGLIGPNQNGGGLYGCILVRKDRFVAS